jgi:porin
LTSWICHVALYGPVQGGMEVRAFIALLSPVLLGFSAAGAQPVVPSSNPAASEMAPGTGELGRLLGLPADGALRLSGVWVGNATGQWSGGVSTLAPSTPVEASNGAQQLLVEASLDLGKAIGFDNTWLWVQGLQVNTTPDAGVASGSVQGSNSLVAAPPLDRTELYEFAIRKDLLDGQLRLIVGKQSGSTQFANVNRPDGTQDARYEVSSLTSLAFTPVYSMPTLLGRLPGYTNSALGLTMAFQPDALKRRLYVSAGVFDGRGGLRDASEQTGLVPPSLSGPLFSIAEVGGGWVAGVSRKPGSLAFGAWSQGGETVVCSKISPERCFSEVGAWGIYGLFDQRLSSFRPDRDSSGINGFMSAGWSPATSNKMGASITAGLTAQGPLESRPNDSVGVGLSWARLNTLEFLAQEFNANELMLQTYAQIALAGSLYLQPTLTFLPLVGAKSAAADSLSGLIQLTLLF